MKKFILIVCFTIIFSTFVNAKTNFIDDFKIQDYSRVYVETLVNNGGINGYTDNTFKPQGTISKIEFLSMCVNSLCDLKSFINNIDTSSYNLAVQKYEFNKIWNGAANDILVLASNLNLSSQFAKNKSIIEWYNPITRAEAAKIIYQSISLLKGEKIDANNFNTSYINDWKLIENSEYEKSIKSLYTIGIVQGNSKGFFNPFNNLTREDSAILICKALDKQKREVMRFNTESILNNNISTTDESISVIKGERGVRSIKNLIKTAFEPLGNVMYIYGGGWNEEDNGAGTEAMTLGLSQRWIEFSQKQTSSYNYKNYDYKKDIDVIHNGLDCSAYIGWIIYNVMNDGKGYVTYSYKMDDMLSEAGYGKVYSRNTYKERRPGDIMASGCNDCKHIYLCLGQCDDGSVLLLHSSPPGVQLTGTHTPQGSGNSEAIKLANKYMSKYYPEWYNKYPDSSRNVSYITHYDKFEWSILSDEEGFRNMTPSEILKNIFGE